MAFTLSKKLILYVVFCASASQWLACSSGAYPSVVFSFDRPSGFSLFCRHRDTGEIAMLSDCNAKDSTAQDTYVKYGFMTESARGEIAVMKLDSDKNQYELIDADVRVPGYTFTPIDEVPSDVVVPRVGASRTFLSHVVSRNVWSLPTPSLLEFPGDLVPQVKMLSSGPVDLELSPDGQRLFAALPDEAKIAFFDIDQNGALSDPTYVSLLGGPGEPTYVVDAGTYRKFCPGDSVIVQPVLPTNPVTVSLGTTPKPVSFIVDDDPTNPRLLIADASLPMIHVLHLPDLVEQTPIHTGVPVRELALTPPVPLAVDGDASVTARYLYAIDASDGSLMVIDYASGSVLAVGVDPLVRSDRIRLRSAVRKLAVLTPDYDINNLNRCEVGSDLATEASPTRLRGVFLAAALADGTLSIVDIYDLDAKCRGGDVCQNLVDSRNSSDQEVYLYRHRPRIGVFVSASTQIFSPSLSGEGSGVTVDATGITASNKVPDLLVLGDTCGNSEQQLFPQTTNKPLICAASDPWVEASGQWIASYNGVIPQANGQRGRLSRNAPVFFGEVSFCSTGVIGRAQAAALANSEPEAAYGGDQVVIISPLANGAAAACNGWLKSDAVGRRTGPAFTIERSFGDHLELVDQAIDTGASFADVVGCFGEFVEYEVRTQRAYAVVSQRGGFLTRVRAATSGECVIDTALPAGYQARALPGVVFRDPWVAFALSDVGPGVQFARLQFQLTAVPAKLFIDLNSSSVGNLPMNMFYNNHDSLLYVVDAAFQGLSMISTSTSQILEVIR